MESHNVTFLPVKFFLVCCFRSFSSSIPESSSSKLWGSLDLGFMLNDSEFSVVWDILERVGLNGWIIKRDKGDMDLLE